MNVATAMKPKERTSLVALLDWSFQRQKAHRIDDSEGFGLRLGSPRDSCAKLEEIGSLMGCRIDGGQWKEIGQRVHPDAQEVVSTIGRLPEDIAALIWRHACSGTEPDWGQDAAFHPVMRGNGKHAVNTAEVVIGDRRGRRSIVTVSYCPVELVPDPVYCREEWRNWYRSLVILRTMLPALTRWEVVGIGVEAEPWCQRTG